jgi:predicted P-loop ATPase
MSRAEAGVLKAFLSRRVDHYRQSYGRRTADFPRQCVFAASTNKDNWAGDETGGRRFWPVRCGEIDIAALARDRDQLLAEALAEYSDGRHWWLEDEAVIKTAAEEQADRFETDPWDNKVMEWILADEKDKNAKEEYWSEIRLRTIIPYSVSHEEILDKCLSLKPDRWGGSEKYRLSKILTFHGFQRWKMPITDQNGNVIEDEDGERKFFKRYRRKPVKGT